MMYTKFHANPSRGRGGGRSYEKGRTNRQIHTHTDFYYIDLGWTLIFYSINDVLILLRYPLRFSGHIRTKQRQVEMYKVVIQSNRLSVKDIGWKVSSPLGSP